MINISESELNYNALLGLLIAHGKRIDFVIYEVDGELPNVLIENEFSCQLGKLFTAYAKGTDVIVEFEHNGEIYEKPLRESNISQFSYGTILNSAYNAIKASKAYVLTCFDTITNDKDIVCKCEVNTDGSIENQKSVERKLVSSNYGLNLVEAKRVLNYIRDYGGASFEEFNFSLTKSIKN